MGVSPTPHLVSHPETRVLTTFLQLDLIFQRVPICFSFLSSSNITSSYSFVFQSLSSQKTNVYTSSPAGQPPTQLSGNSCVCTLQYLAPQLHSRALNAVKLIRAGAEKLHDLPNVTQIHQWHTKQQLTNITQYFRLGKALWRSLTQTPALSRTDLPVAQSSPLASFRHLQGWTCHDFSGFDQPKNNSVTALHLCSSSSLPPFCPAKDIFHCAPFNWFHLRLCSLCPNSILCSEKSAPSEVGLTQIWPCHINSFYVLCSSLRALTT